MSLFSKVRKNVPTETIPIVTIVTGAVMGAGYYLYRLSQGSEVVWNRHGDQRPWDKIQQHENTKFLSYNPDFWAKRKEEAAAKRASASA